MASNQIFHAPLPAPPNKSSTCKLTKLPSMVCGVLIGISIPCSANLEPSLWHGQAHGWNHLLCRQSAMRPGPGHTEETIATRCSPFWMSCISWSSALTISIKCYSYNKPTRSWSTSTCKISGKASQN